MKLSSFSCPQYYLSNVKEEETIDCNIYCRKKCVECLLVESPGGMERGMVKRD